MECLFLFCYSKEHSLECRRRPIDCTNGCGQVVPREEVNCICMNKCFNWQYCSTNLGSVHLRDNVLFAVDPLRRGNLGTNFVLVSSFIFYYFASVIKLPDYLLNPLPLLL